METKKKEKGWTVLVVDDEPGNRALYSEIIRQMGCRVIDRADVVSAMAVVREGAEIDLVVTDYRMPDRSGLEFIEDLRQVMPSVPVIMITAYASIENYVQSQHAGVFEYINKPFVKREFERVVQAALTKSTKDAA